LVEDGLVEAYDNGKCFRNQLHKPSFGYLSNEKVLPGENEGFPCHGFYQIVKNQNKIGRKSTGHESYERQPVIDSMNCNIIRILFLTMGIF